MYLLIGVLTLYDSLNLEPVSEASNPCGDVHILDSIVALSISFAYACVSFAYYKVIIDCWYGLKQSRNFKKFITFLIIIASSCAYRVLNDVVSAVFPTWVLSGSQNNISVFFKEVIPAGAVILTIVLLKPFKFTRTLPESDIDSTIDFRNDPTFHLVKFTALRNIEKITEGGSAWIYRCTWTDREGVERIVALKEIRTPSELDSKIEIVRLALLEHPNVLKFYGHTITDNGFVGIITNYAQKGSLQSLLQHETLHFAIRLRMALDVAEGMKYIHKKNLVHRDLKTENVFVNEEYRCMIGDFGSTTIGSGCEGLVGTPGFMAPDVLNKNYGRKVDIFSFGVLLWVLVNHGKQPFSSEMYSQQSLQPLADVVGVVGSTGIVVGGHKDSLDGVIQVNVAAASLAGKPMTHRDFIINVLQKGKRPPLLPGLNPKIVKLMERCWSQNPEERPEFARIVDTLQGPVTDEWIKMMDSGSTDTAASAAAFTSTTTTTTTTTTTSSATGTDLFTTSKGAASALVTSLANALVGVTAVDPESLPFAHPGSSGIHSSGGSHSHSEPPRGITILGDDAPSVNSS
ncbi:Serine/threonine-protein kinase HT1 [Pelomyxa schiedti]|nr:Serine/threonine-protein kinase HT1 [Pelomyxa schiedti]